MDDAFSVRIRNTGQYLKQEKNRLFERQGRLDGNRRFVLFADSLNQLVAQTFTTDILHGYVHQLVFCASDVMRPDDIRMRKRASDKNFVAEAPEYVLVLRQVRMQQLEGDEFVVQFPVYYPEDLAHPACTDPLANLVPPGDDHARSEVVTIERSLRSFHFSVSSKSGFTAREARPAAVPFPFHLPTKL